MGAKDLLADGVEHGTRVIERSQRSVARRVAAVAGALSGRQEEAERIGDAAGAVFTMGYRNTRMVARLIRLVLDAAHDVTEPMLRGRGAAHHPVPLRSDETGNAAWLWDGFIGGLNGIVGDHLAATDNPLAIAMRMRLGDRFITPGDADLAEALAERPAKLCVFVHGLSATEWSWAFEAEAQQGTPEVNYGSLLQGELGHVPLYVRYNTGLHISDNAQQLDELLQATLDGLPHEVDEIALIGHSLGGLVAMGAAHYGDAAGRDWVKRLRHVINIAAPHQGAPLEKFGHLAVTIMGAIDTPGTRIPAEVISARSAGIKDLRHGHVVEEDWRDESAGQGARSAVRRLDGVHYHRIAATITEDPGHLMGQLVGDTMVRTGSAVDSAASVDGDEHPGEVAIVGGLSHVALANHPRVYAHLRDWLAS